MNVFLICTVAVMKKKTDSSKSCTEFIVAFVSVNFLKKHILEMEAKYVCWGQRVHEEPSPL